MDQQEVARRGRYVVEREICCRVWRQAVEMGINMIYNKYRHEIGDRGETELMAQTRCLIV